MTHITAHTRLWLVPIAVAIFVLAAATFALARGSAPTNAQSQRPITQSYPVVDDTRPVGPSDPPGLVGVLVQNGRKAEGGTR